MKRELAEWMGLLGFELSWGPDQTADGNCSACWIYRLLEATVGGGIKAQEGCNMLRACPYRELSYGITRIPFRKRGNGGYGL
jgi:hypothetical protein